LTILTGNTNNYRVRLSECHSRCCRLFRCY